MFNDLMCRSQGNVPSYGWMAILVPLLAVPVVAQDGPEDFGEVLEVRVVNVEVVVTDRDGQRVTGLGRDDFRLRVAGREVPIEYFTEIRDGRAAEAREAPKASTGEVAPAPEAMAPGEPVPTSFLVFLDEMFMVGTRRDRVLKRLEEQLALLGPQDRMAVVTYDGRHLEVLTGWTAPGPHLRSVLKDARERPVHGLKRIAERRSLLSGSEERAGQRTAFREELAAGQRESFGRDVSTRLAAEQRAYAELLAAQLGCVADASAGAMRAFAEAPGRKVMLLLSGGWHFDPAEAAADHDQARASVADRDVPGGEEIFEPLVETANLLGYTLYPIDVPGLEGQNNLVTRAAPASGITEETPTGGGAGLLGEHATQTTLLHLASRTGGKALLNNLRDEALELPVADTRSYYWLGFTHAWERDDEVHRLDIEVLRPGLTARSRRSLLDLSRDAEVAARLESYLFLGPPEDLLLPVRVREIEKAGRKLVRVSLTLAIPVRAVTFFPRGDGFEATLDLRMLAVDEAGGRSETPSVPLQLTAEEPPSPDGHVRYDTEITLRDAPHEVVLSVHDPASGTLLANRLRIDPNATASLAVKE